ncbi:MAG: methyltransferase domain-containing protein [Candidatus Omnitrophota bacterium]
MSVHVKCNVCGVDHYKVVYKLKKKKEESCRKSYLITQSAIPAPEQIVQCLKCSLVYVNPQRDPKDILLTYEVMKDEDYLKEEKGRRYGARALLKKLKKYRKVQAKLLEIGCASGFLLDEARREGWDAHGVELSWWASAYAKNTFGLNVFCGTLESAHFPSSYFDAVVLTDTLEHLVNPKETLLEIRRILKTSGVVYLSSPNINSFYSRILKARWWGINQHHLYYFTKTTLRRLLMVTRFKAVKWSQYERTFTVSYWREKLQGYNKGLANLAGFFTRSEALSNVLFTIKTSDQISVIAQKKRLLADLQETEPDESIKENKKKIKVVAVLPAYNAARTLERTIKDIPRDIVDEILLVDDASSDDTVAVAERLGLVVFKHEKNKGYGANQKTCYTEALKMGADIIVMVHPDYQYDPKVIPELVGPIQRGEADAVFGSRMLKGGALEGGMPLWKHNCNVIFTAIANVILGTYLTEYHSGFRAYSAELLCSIRFMDNSDNFVFDAEIIVQIVLHYFKIDEIPIRTRYFEEASVISLWQGFWYGVDILNVLFKYGLHKNNIIKFRQFS